MRPFSVAIVAAEHLDSLARWCGAHLGHFYVAIATLLTNVLQRLEPAITETFRDLGTFLCKMWSIGREFGDSFMEVITQSRIYKFIIDPFTLAALSLTIGIPVLILLVHILVMRFMPDRYNRFLAWIDAQFTAMKDSIELAASVHATATSTIASEESNARNLRRRKD